MLRVDVVTNTPTPYNAALFHALSQRVDLRVHFEAPADALRPCIGTFVDGFDSVIHAGTPIGRWGFWTPGLAKSLRRDADVLVLAGSYTSPTIAVLLLERPKGSSRLFWGERFMTSSVTNSLIRRRLFGRVDGLLAVGEQAAQQYRVVTRAPVHVLPYAAAAGDLGPDTARDRIGFVGQIIKRKGLDLLLEACARTDAPPVDIVGSGPFEDQLRHDGAARRLDVTWHGECPNSAIASIRSAWAFQVVPSRYDGWGVVVNEALASGTPVVVSSTAGAAELIRDGVNGWIHAGNDVGSLCDTIRRALEHCADDDVRRAAAVTGDAFSADKAACFLVDLLTGPPDERSFIEEQWQAAEVRLRGQPDPDDGVPYSI